MTNKHLIFIKLGGAVITNKSVSESVRSDVLSRLIGEIARASREKNLKIVLGNGAGSFAHVPASKYKTMDGFINEESRLGMAVTQDSAARLNRIVVKECLDAGFPAVTLAPSNTIVTNEKKAETAFLDVIEEYLEKNLIPVVYGDVLVDKKRGCTIWSTDKVFTFLARELEKKGWEVDQIIHVTEAHGVWKAGQENVSQEKDKVIFETITPDSASEVKESMVDIKGIDVTGGMWHKIEESISLTKLGIETQIISGLTPNALFEVLSGNKNIGTRITKI